MIPCTACSAPHATPLQLCPKCVQQLTDALLQLPELIAELEVCLSKEAVHRPGKNSAVRDDARLPFNLGASTVLTAIKGTLTSWARLVADERVQWELVLDAAGHPQQNEDGSPVMAAHPTILTCTEDPTSICRWLYRYTRWLAAHDAAADALGELHELLQPAREAIDIRPDPVFVGICRNTTGPDGDPLPAPCKERLYTEDTSRRATVECKRCGAVQTARSLQVRSLDAAEDRLLTAKSITRALQRHGEPIGEHDVKNWTKRGLLTPAGWAKRERAHLYRVGDVRDLLHSMEAKHAARIAAANAALPIAA